MSFNLTALTDSQLLTMAEIVEAKGKDSDLQLIVKEIQRRAKLNGAK